MPHRSPRRVIAPGSMRRERTADVSQIRATGQGALTLLPESETECFVKELDAQITFERDVTGAVTALVLHQGGQDQRARKTK